jgi:hypothetical protein
METSYVDTYEDTSRSRDRTLSKYSLEGDPLLGGVHYRDGRDSCFADAGDIAERVAFCRYN